MARCRLSIHQADGKLPMICMRCAAPATTMRSKRMSWYPPWVIVTILGGVLPFAVIALILTKRAHVQAPLCDQHKGHWSRRVLIHVACLLLLVLGTVGGIALMANAPRPMQDQFGGILCVAGAGALLGWLILAVVLQMTSIRPAEITDNEITLAGVCSGFVDAIDQAEHDRRMKLRDMRSRRADDDYVPRPVRPADAIAEDAPPAKRPASDTIEE